MNCGIIGFPNVGKSTLFNALTATASAQAANYPFCTIEPNVGTVCVPDDRLSELAKRTLSSNIIPTQLSFVDIAGLVKGASQGEGLGNQFLTHIRQVDALLHVVRCFAGDVVHVSGRVDPLDDIAIIETELMLADLQSLEKRLSKKKQVDDQLPFLKKAYDALSNGLFASAVWQPEYPQLDLLTLKPMIYICNVGEDDLRAEIEWVSKVKAATRGRAVLTVCNQVEAEIALLPIIDQQSFLTAMGLKETGLSQIIRTTYEVLNLITFFTAGPKEVRAWPLLKGSTAFDAAGCIHTDFQKGFIRAEVIGYADYVAHNTAQAVKEAGKMRLEGKDYIMHDGDVVMFRFNV